MTDELIRQLREGGYADAADNVRDTMIAQRLREAGRADLAETLESKTEPGAKSPAETEGDAFLQELRDKQEAPWSSAGKLLG